MPRSCPTAALRNEDGGAGREKVGGMAAPRYRTGDPELMHNLTSQITRAALPEFYFHHRGG